MINGRRGRRVLGALFSLGLVSGLGLTATSSAVAAGGHPGSEYTSYSFPKDTGTMKEVTWTTTPLRDPGYTADVFWAHQFGLDDKTGGYIGMQSNGGAERRLVFSLWNATGSRPGDRGATCSTFHETGQGRHCVAPLGWRAGHTYVSKVAAVGHGWFKATVTDATAGTSIDLGSLKTRASGISPKGMSDWTEAFEWNNPRSTCYDQPSAAVSFGLPQGNGGTVNASVASTKISMYCKSLSRVEVTRQGSVQLNAIGNTVRGLVRHGEQCLSAPGRRTDGMSARLSDCRATIDRGWVHAADRTLRLAYGGCLTQDGDAVHVRDCKGSRELGTFGRVSDDAKRWTYDKSSMALTNVRSGRCLTAAADGRLTVGACGGGRAQKWTVPSACGAGTPSKTPESAPTPASRPAEGTTGNSASPLRSQPPAAGGSDTPTVVSPDATPEDSAPKKDISLAETGADNATLPLSIATGVLLAVGALFVWAARSRRSRSGEERANRRDHV
ncbi:hypothetical protein J2Z21_000670 [Streptomyces griseochromogenes]|uniref:Ricin B lectin domain-containing protein n=1 Tax=Streptomyces griseochromogenes TaxID=68214 RepID=A0A1B1B2K8_9ACTN|nr:ricin-type beta-trefoil lectin domain protein [Streptomyces griseochromogenes]ANP53065.1 hypothetical protein AVL59_29130 [Streptomyces griseochromogenes]MBP2047748.1 hypothetical protein [Streptomyces griseochromogenes]